MINNNSSENPWVVTFSMEDTIEDKFRKAAHVKPSAAQLEWMEKEYIAYIHFGPNTYSGRQWGTGHENPAIYTPTALDPEQWARVCADADMKMAIFTMKHHDGFCQWVTDTTDFSVVNSPINKDVVDLFRKGCDNNNIGFGVYLSPWDMNQRDRGLWGTKSYNRYFIAQLNELLTRYGRADEVWFDGACSDYEIWKAVPSYRPDAWYDLIETVQPNAVFRMYDPYFFASEEKWKSSITGNDKLEWRGKAVRWVGNEEGESRTDEWSVQPVFDREIAENATFPDLGQEKYYKDAVGAVWYPLEVNTTILNQWFWNPDTSSTKSLLELIEIFYNSIGNNGVLLLNVSPDRSGVIPEDQIQRLMELKDFMQRTFNNNLALGATINPTSEKFNYSADSILDNDKMTCWTTEGEWDINSSTASIIFEMGQVRTFDNVLVQEYIREGQRIVEWSFDVWIGNSWKELVHNKTIGYKNIKRFKSVTTERVRLNILRSWDNPMISNFGLYLSDIPQEVAKVKDSVQKGPEPDNVDSTELILGLNYTYYFGGVQTAALIESITSVKPVKSGVIGTFSIEPTEVVIGYSIAYTGYIKVPFYGTYTFKLESANGSVLYIGNELCVDNDEPHGIKAVERKIKLKSGYHPVKVLYTSFRQEGMLKVSWSGPGLEMQEIKADNLYHKGKI
ncbi:MAG: alpha-L-fucosidase [Vallitaleaceae bacterium]|nr:alpha-L-fucosidase [Vallitaleaceae bacterium]